jgi:diguanylate cyclase (GGDEF)-like protein
VNVQRDREHSSLRRVLPLLVPVALAGSAATAVALAVLVVDPPPPSTWAALAAVFAAGVLVEASPIRLRGLPAGRVALSSVFFIGAAVMFGAAEATVVALAVRFAVDVAQRRPRIRLLYNGPVYALSAGAAGGVAAQLDGDSVGRLVACVAAATAAYYAVNLVLVTAAIARVEERPFVPLVAATARATLFPFSIMASGALMLVVLWERSPLLALALVGPLLAVALYERSTQAALIATQLALTDGLTGLGNQRHFHERLQAELDTAARDGSRLALCLLDVDGLKHVNDTRGHAVGDLLLERTASMLRHGGEAFRVGGDEFALLLPGTRESAALETATAILDRVAALEPVEAEKLRLSCGVALFPAAARHDLYRAADAALYASKREGLGRVHMHRPDDPRPVGAAAA